MKKIGLVLGIMFSFYSCEDVIEVDLPEDASRISIDALVRLDTSEAFTTVSLKASLTSGFFNEITPAEISNVAIINSTYVPTSALDLNTVPLNEVSPGVYEGSKQTAFFTEGELQLAFTHEDQRYIALTNFVPSAPITKLEQGTQTLFSGEEIEVIIAFDDDLERDNFYLVDLDFDEFLVTEDEFYQGQKFEFSYFYDEGVTAGQEVTISLLGVDEPFYNYMNQLIVQAGGDQGPFQTPAATVRGNIINVTNIDNINSFDNVEDSNNFALGYFAVVQEFKQTIIIE